MKKFALTKSEIRIEKWKHLVGKVPDQAIAELSDVSASTVTLYRKKRGIPPQTNFNSINRFKRPVKNENERLCECGGKGLHRFKGEFVCDDCYNPPIPKDELEKHIWSGISNSCCVE